MSSKDQRPIGESWDSENLEVANMLVKHRESDRGCVIFCAAMVEAELERLLRLHFRTEDDVVKKVVDPLFCAYAPLSTFSAKIAVCYALGLIPTQTHKALELLRRLRNDFAHAKINVSFQSSGYQSRLTEYLRLVEEGEGERMLTRCRDLLEGLFDPVSRTFDESKQRSPVPASKTLVDRVAFSISTLKLVTKIGAFGVIAESGRRKVNIDEVFGVRP